MEKLLRKVVSMAIAVAMVITSLVFVPARVEAKTALPDNTATKVGAWELKATNIADLGWSQMSYDSTGDRLGDTTMYLDNSPNGDWGTVEYGLYARLKNYSANKMEADMPYKLAITINTTNEGTLIAQIEGKEYRIPVEDTGTITVYSDQFDHDAFASVDTTWDKTLQPTDVTFYFGMFPKDTEITMSDVDFVKILDDVEETEKNTTKETTTMETTTINPWIVVGGSPSNTYYWKDPGYPYGLQVINIQSPKWAEETGVYITVQEPIINVTVNGSSDGADIQGAGTIVYLSKLTKRINEVTIDCGYIYQYNVQIKNIYGSEESTTVFPTTEAPSESPTVEPSTEAPTVEPSTEAPTQEPTTQAPTEITTQVPTQAPTQQPTEPTTAESGINMNIDILSPEDNNNTEVGGYTVYSGGWADVTAQAGVDENNADHIKMVQKSNSFWEAWGLQVVKKIPGLTAGYRYTVEWKIKSDSNDGTVITYFDEQMDTISLTGEEQTLTGTTTASAGGVVEILVGAGCVGFANAVEYFQPILKDSSGKQVYPSEELPSVEPSTEATSVEPSTEPTDTTTQLPTESPSGPPLPCVNWSFMQGGCYATAQETEWGNVGYIERVKMATTGEEINNWERGVYNTQTQTASADTGAAITIENNGWDAQWKENTGYPTRRIYPWSIQAMAKFNGMNFDHRYKVTFKAKATKKKYCYITFNTVVDGQEMPPYNQNIEELTGDEQVIVLGTQEKEYTYTFPNYVGGSELTIDFMLGAFLSDNDGNLYDYEGNVLPQCNGDEIQWKNGTVAISGVKIEDLDPEKPTAEPESTTNPETQTPTQAPSVEPTTIPEPTTSANPDIDALREQVNQLSESLAQHIEDYNTQISTLEAQLAQLQGELEDDDEALSGRIDSLNTQLTDIRNQIVDINSAMEDLENDVANNSASIGDLQSDMESVLDDLSTVDNRIEDTKTEVENTVKAYVDDQVEELSGEINIINNSINELIALIGVVPEGTNLQSEIVDIQNSVQAIKDELDSVDLDQIDKNKQQISTLQSQLLSITNTIAQNLLTETQNRINDTSRLTNTIDTINNSLKAKDVELQTQIDTLNSQLQIANADIQSINEQVVEIQGDIAANATNISKNASDIQSLVEQLSAAVAELNTVDNRIQTAKDDTLTLAQTYTDQKIAELNAEFENRMKEQGDDFTNKYNEQKDEIDRLNKEILGLKMSSGSTSVRLSYASKSSVNLNWNKHPYASGYEVYVMKPGKSSYELVADVKSQAFSYSIAMNLSYKFMVKAYMNDEKSASKVYGLDSNAVTANAVTPGKVVLKKVKAAKKKCTVQWNAVPKAMGYQIYYKQKKAKTITVKANQLSQVIKKLKKKKKVTVKVRAFVTYGVNTLYGAWSNTKKVKIK